MYTAHFGFRARPFYPLTDPGLIYWSNEIREVVNHFAHGRLNHEAFFLLTGEVGTGKSTAIRAILRELPAGTPAASISHSSLTPRELLQEIAHQLALPELPEEPKPKLLRRLQALLSGSFREDRQAVLVLDEAHLLSDEALEELRLLSNLRAEEGHPLLQICLVGQPELLGRLRQPHLRPLRQRVTSRYAMGPLSASETGEYLKERLRAVGAERPAEVFEPRAAAAIHRLSGGIPREINVVAGHALMNAFVEDARVVGPRHVRTIRKDYGFEGVRLPRLEPGKAVAWLRAAGASLAGAFRTPSFRTGLRDVLVTAASLGLVVTGAFLLLRPDFGVERPNPVREVALPRPIQASVTTSLPPRPREPRPLPEPPPSEESASLPPPGERALPPEARETSAPRRAAAPRPQRSLEERYPSTLKVESEIPVVVWLGEERIGVAPGTFSPIPPGRHRVQLEANGGRILEKDVIITPGSTTYVRAGSLAP